MFALLSASFLNVFRWLLWSFTKLSLYCHIKWYFISHQSILFCKILQMICYSKLVLSQTLYLARSSYLLADAVSRPLCFLLQGKLLLSVKYLHKTVTIKLYVLFTIHMLFIGINNLLKILKIAILIVCHFSHFYTEYSCPSLCANFGFCSNKSVV